MDESIHSETFHSMRDQIFNTFADKKIFVTSSFQTYSIPLLHMVSRIRKDLPIYFLNTGFHFPETLSFKNDIGKLLGLNVIELRSFTSKIHQRDSEGNLLFTSDPDYCCYLNKVQPLEAVLIEYDVWISGVRAEQTKNRETFKVVDDGPFHSIRYHPLLHWTNKDIEGYIEKYTLPSHPLDDIGYASIGCMPCTRRIIPNGINERDGRWMGLTKTECGLHTELVGKK